MAGLKTDGLKAGDGELKFPFALRINFLDHGDMRGKEYKNVLFNLGYALLSHRIWRNV